MAVITIGTTGGQWGLSSETGIIAQDVTFKAGREKNIKRDQNGEPALIAFYGATQTVHVHGIIIGSSGVAAAAPGVALTLSNTNTLNGVSSGACYVDDVELKKVNVDFVEINVNGTQYANIP